MIASAKKRICIVVLYLENDDGGTTIMDALYSAKKSRPELDISILVDRHRAQRNRIGISDGTTNADWYYELAQRYSSINIPVYGVPVNTHEALGIMHLKGTIIDDNVLYSGASINDVYLNQHRKYRYDRYQVIKNHNLANTMYMWIDSHLRQAKVTKRLDQSELSSSDRNQTRKFRRILRKLDYDYKYQSTGCEVNSMLTATPIVGLGTHNSLNKTILSLVLCTRKKLTLCTPYFNLPRVLINHLSIILKTGKKVEIIVGDKTANDFYIPPSRPFQLIGITPYLYEINLCRFLDQFQLYMSNGQLVVRLWKDGENSYHLKGIWVDKEWILVTGNNLNPRAWRLDLENAILIHDPNNQLTQQRQKELDTIRYHTQIIESSCSLDSITDYPIKVRRLVRNMRRIHVDRLISYIL
jgi:CDP-diacylglycerol--serine O-phosphatidyltransferase